MSIEMDDTVRVDKPGHQYHGRIVEVDWVDPGGAYREPKISVSISSSGFSGGNGGWAFRYTGFDLAPNEVVLVRKGNDINDEVQAVFAWLDSRSER